MKTVIKLSLFCLAIIFLPSIDMLCETSLNLPGYSEWNTTKTNDEKEVSAIQYGRLVPIEWSNWDENSIDSPYQKQKVGNVNHYSYSGNTRVWHDPYSKELFTWDFNYPKRVTYIYVDVDTYVDGSYTNYQGPPLQLYCDNNLVASVGTHDYNNNWNPYIDCECRYLKLTMSSNSNNGRNATSIVGTWATTTSTLYSHVVRWSEGQDYRFDEPYEHLYGEDSQIPVEREVFSHPLTYTITYDLNKGQALGELITHYTIFDEVEIPLAYKIGYSFEGYFDDNGIEIKKIEKGTYGDITLHAHYIRKEPTIYVGNAYFEKEDKTLSLNEIIEIVNASASDDLDGDLTDKIKIDYIFYEDDNRKDDNPNGLDVSKTQKVNIKFDVENSDGIKATKTKSFYILGKHEIDANSDNDIEIYTRFIDEKNMNTIKNNSIWKDNEYLELLNRVFKKMKGE